jgi:hypothetical protein
MDGRHKRFLRDHNRVEPGDAIGVAIRMTVARASIVAELLAPSISAERILRLPGAITLYATVGRDSLNGHPASHRWVSVITDPPEGVPPDDGIGGLACIGAASDEVNRMWWRHGLGRVPGRLAVALDKDRWEARVRIATAGGTMTVAALFAPVGEPWVALPQHYYVLGQDPPALLLGDEWGTRHDGSGSVEFRSPRGVDTFDAQVGLDLDLGWDYTLAERSDLSPG